MTLLTTDILAIIIALGGLITLTVFSLIRIRNLEMERIELLRKLNS